MNTFPNADKVSLLLRENETAVFVFELFNVNFDFSRWIKLFRSAIELIVMSLKCYLIADTAAEYEILF